MEGSVIRGPFALCDHAVVKLASKFMVLQLWEHIQE
jgi:hypothetical protein